MADRNDPSRLLAQYRDAMEPPPGALEAIWKDVADPDARTRVVEPRPRRGERRSRARVVLGGLGVLAAASVVVWWASPGRWGTRAAGPDRPDAAMLEHAATPASGHATKADGREGARAPAAVEAGGTDGAAGPIEPSTERSTLGPRGVSRGADSSATRRAPRGETAGEHEPDALGSSDRRSAGPRDPSPGARGTPPRRDGAPATDPAAPGDVSPPSGAPVERADSLALETATIERAEAALRRGDPATALRHLERHAARFPTGALAIERQALRVIALCASGNRPQGRGEAAMLERHRLSRPYRERIALACDEP